MTSGTCESRPLHRSAAAGGRAMGVDVSVARGLDVVVLDAARRVVDGPLARQDVRELPALVAAFTPAVVAIDSPPAWGAAGPTRVCELGLRARGLNVFSTPSDPAAFSNPFYGWMRVGQEAFAAVGMSHRVHGGETDVAGCALEVFPHATAVCLAGYVPDGVKRPARRRAWRRRVLEAAGVETGALRTLDQLDAALAALTGLLALVGNATALGGDDGWIVLPALDLPRRFPRRPVTF